MNCFSENLILLNNEFQSSTRALEELAQQFVANKVAKNDFIDNILEREKNFPTGLELEKYGVAIPHTDSKYVLEDQIGIMTLNKPVLFKNMADANLSVEVNLIFMLGLKQSDKQPLLLQKLMEMFQDSHTMESIKTANSVEEVKELINKYELANI